jgi:hypothetical protein
MYDASVLTDYQIYKIKASGEYGESPIKLKL